MKFSCAACGQRVEVESLYAGYRLPCPKCGRDLCVPSAPSAGPSARTAASEPQGAESCAPAPAGDSDAAESAVAAANVLTPAGARYEVGSVVARGGMGAILDARDKNIRRNVAMKVMLDPNAPQEDVARFIEEAQVTGQLEHPGIVPIHELGVNGEGGVFYTMRFVRGPTLKDILQELRQGLSKSVARYPLGHLLTILQKTCDAVAFAHSRGVVHRDLKPENILIGEYGEVLVLDWGLAKLLPRRKTMRVGPAGGPRVRASGGVESARRESGRDGTGTLSGSVMGTPGYMAPEQAAGEVDRIDERTDIYALGAILYAILTLHPPVEGPTLDALIARTARGDIPHPTVYDAASRRRRSPAPPAGAKADRDHGLPHMPGGRVPASLAAVAMKALSCDPASRYASVKELQRDIEAFQNGFATTAESAGLWTQAKLFVRRHRGAAAAAGLIAVLLVASSIVNLEARLRAVRALSERNALAGQAAPEFLAKSRRLVQEGQYEAALNAIDVAIGLDGRPGILHMQRGYILQDLLRFDQAGEAFEAAAARGVRGRALETNRRLCAELAAVARDLERKRGAPVEGWPVEIVAPLANSLEAQGRLAEASVAYGRASTNAAAAMRQWQTHLKAMGPAVFQDPDEFRRRVRLDASGRLRIDLRRVSPLENVAFLASMPVHALDLEGVDRNLDLSPLSRTPIRWLNLRENRRLASLAGLRGTQLEELQLRQCTSLKSLDGLQECAITSLDLSGLGSLADVSALSNAPLRSLDVTDCRSLSSIAGLRRCSLTQLSVARCARLMSLEGLQGSRLRHLDARECLALADISALRGMPLERLDLDMGMGPPNAALRSLEGLQGTQLRSLDARKCAALTDAGALQGLAITNLHLRGCRSLRSLDGLEAAVLKRLDLEGCQSLASIAALRASPLAALSLRDCRSLSSLDGVQRARLTELDAEGCLALADVRALRGIPVRWLNLSMGRYTHGKDLVSLDGLQGTDLRFLSAENCRGLTDLTALRGLPLTNLVLRGCVALKTLTGLESAELRCLDLSGCAEVRDLAPLSRASLRVFLAAGCERLASLEPLRGMPLETVVVENCRGLKSLGGLQGARLRHVNAGGCPTLYDIGALAGHRLQWLSLGRSIVDDIQVLRGMPLRHLSLQGTRVRDLSVLAGMPLESLWVDGAPVSDLAPLRGMGLRELGLRDCPVSDLRPLAGMKLARLNIQRTKVSDCSTLDGMELESLEFSARGIQRGLEVVRRMKSLVRLRDDALGAYDYAPAEFWAKFDAAGR